MTYGVTKTFDIGLSAAFRQWRATHSHCRFIHGYALTVRVSVESPVLDGRNWVTDFGSGFAELRRWLVETFDHKLLVDAADPNLALILSLGEAGLAEVRVLNEGVGCERFAELIFREACERIDSLGGPRVVRVEVSEHGANTAYVVR